MSYCYRPTTLKLASAHCPRAIDFYESKRARFYEVYQQGIAAHECLATIGARAVDRGEPPDAGTITALAEATARKLIESGRSFDGVPEPPMSAEDAFAGRDLAIAYAVAETTTWPVVDAWVERGLAFDASWKPVAYDAKSRRFRLIPDAMAIIDDGGEDYSGRLALVRDYKSAWSTDEGELDTYQMRAQAVAAWLTLPDIDGVRREVVNIRTGQTFRDDIWLESGGKETLLGWRDDITAYMGALDKMIGPDGLRPVRPGVGCLSCPWAISCDSAHPLATKEQALGERLAKIEGEKAEIVKALKLACAEKPVVLSNGQVGWQRTEKRQPKADSVQTAWAWWQKGGGDLDGFLAALRPSIAGLENVAELVVKAMSHNDEAPTESNDQLDMTQPHAPAPMIDRSAAASLVAQWMDSKKGREFGVHRAPQTSPDAA